MAERKSIPPHKNKLLATYLTPDQCRENALRSLAKAMKAKDRRAVNRFKKVAEAWEELAAELSTPSYDD